MASGRMRVLKELTFLLKPNERLIDVQLHLLEVMEPFNTRYGFLCRFYHILYFFNNQEDAFTFLNFLYRLVYGSYLFNSLSGLKAYSNTIPELKDSEYYRILNDEIINLVSIDID